MYINVQGESTFVATGGKPFNPQLPTVVLLHGSGLDHRCWVLQSRWFAFHGYSVLVPDFPGHSLSAGEPLSSIPAMGQWLVDMLHGVKTQQVHLVGHSQGFLVALEAAVLLAQSDVTLKSVTAVATAASIPVNETLIAQAKQSPDKAADMMLQWGFGPCYQYGVSAIPGLQPIAMGHRIMSNNPLAEDLIACNQYHLGETQAAKIACPTQVILGTEDRMTPISKGKHLASVLGVTAQVVPQAGHMLPMEASQTSLAMMKQFIHGIYS